MFILGQVPLWAAGISNPFSEPHPTSPLVSIASPNPLVKVLITEQEAKTLLKEFLKAQASELKAIEHRTRFELKELKSSQDTRQREWKKAEDDARHTFFEVHNQGPERRTYIQDFIKRRDQFRRSLSDERTQKTQEKELNGVQVRQKQLLNLNEFKKSLERKERPDPGLWPSAGQ